MDYQVILRRLDSYSYPFPSISICFMGFSVGGNADSTGTAYSYSTITGSFATDYYTSRSHSPGVVTWATPT